MNLSPHAFPSGTHFSKHIFLLAPSFSNRQELPSSTIPAWQLSAQRKGNRPFTAQVGTAITVRRTKKNRKWHVPVQQSSSYSYHKQARRQEIHHDFTLPEPLMYNLLWLHICFRMSLKTQSFLPGHLANPTSRKSNLCHTPSSFLPRQQGVTCAAQRHPGRSFSYKRKALNYKYHFLSFHQNWVVQEK